MRITKRFIQQDMKQLDVYIPVISSERGLRVRGSIWFIITTVAVAIFSDIFLFGVIVPVIPFAFITRMGIEPNMIQAWVSRTLAGYSVGLFVGSIVFGYACDKMGHRKSSMLIGLLLVIATILILCLTRSVALFMVGRVIQGFSASVVWTVGLAIIADTAPPNRIATLMGYPAIGMSLGMFLGPVLGGIIYEQAGYYAVFGLCFALLGFDVAMRLLMLERKDLQEKLERRGLSLADESTEELEHEHEPDSGLEPVGPAEPASKQQQQAKESPDDDTQMKGSEQALPHSSCSPQTPHPANSPLDSKEAEAQQPSHGLNSQGPDLSPEDYTVRWHGYEVPPIIQLLAYPRVLNVLFQTIMVAWATALLDAATTIHLNQLFGFNSLYAGLMMLAVSVPMFLEPAAGWLCDKIGYKYVMAGGFLASMPFFIILRVPDHNSTGQIVLFAAILALLGFAYCLIFAPLLAELTGAIAEIEESKPGIFGPSRGYGQAYGLQNICIGAGSLIGPFHAQAAVESGGWNLATLTGGILMGVTTIPTLLFTDGNVAARWWTSLRRWAPRH